MPERVVGTPISVQETRETISATVDIESGMTDFLIRTTLTNSETGELVVAQVIRETAPTSDVKSAIDVAVVKSAGVNTQEAI